MTERTGSPELKLNAAVAAVCVLIFAAACLHLARTAAPHEDALILFKYAKNLFETGVISYSVGGPPAEGATDFLFMAVVSGVGGALGDYYAAAAPVNAAGLTGLLWMICAAAGPDAAPMRSRRLVVALAALALVVSPAFVPSVWGFSALSYAAMTTLLVHLLHRRPGWGLAMTPLIGLAAGLWRPDGVIAGVIAAGIAFAILRRANPSRLPAFFAASGAALVLGLCYFGWRWSYFGEMLPLPLMVKSTANAVFPGLLDTAKAVVYCAPVLFAAALGRRPLRLLLALSPVLALTFALTFAVQSQNIAYRFEAPLFAAAVYGFAAGALDRDMGRIARLLACGAVAGFCILAGWKIAAYNFRKLGDDDYLLRLSALQIHIVDADDRIVLTEAGKLAYFSDARLFDATGLNNAEAASARIDANWVEDQSPDVAMFHPASVFAAPADLTGVRPFPCGGLEAMRNPRAEVEGSVMFAADAIGSFLALRAADFECYLVGYAGDPHQHVYGVRREWPKADAYVAALRDAVAGSALSYRDALVLARDAPGRPI